jgi:RimJ/RimL family protein N-acetyltransferase
MCASKAGSKTPGQNGVWSIREAVPADAERLLDLKTALDGETRFMLLEPGERMSSVTNERTRLEALSSQANSVVLVAQDNDDLVAYAEASGGDFRRNRQTAHVVIGVRRSYTGRGLGTRLLTELDRWAVKADVRRLELTVMTHNLAAIALYRKRGYRVEGTRRAALIVDGEYVDEFWMAKVRGISAGHAAVANGK